MPEPTTARAPSAPTPPDQILDILIGHWKSRAVAVAAELELADVLAEGPLPVESLAGRTHTHAPSLFRLMRALESIGIFAQVSPRVFANTPASDCLRKHLPGSQWGGVRALLSTGSGRTRPGTGSWTVFKRAKPPSITCTAVAYGNGSSTMRKSGRSLMRGCGSLA